MITENSKNKLALFVTQMYRQIQFGSGGDASNPYVNTLDAPLATSATLYTTNILANDTTIDFTYTLLGNTTGIVGQTIQEIGIFGLLPTDADQTANMAKSKGSIIVEGNQNWADHAAYTVDELTMLFRIPIDPITVQINEVYDIVVTLEVM
jgi:protein involved in ribonucleotide reduction